MRIDVVTLFPQMFEVLSDYGITGRAVSRGILELATWNPREHASNRHQTVDDRPYGGGPGMVMMVQPLRDSIRDARAAAADKSRVIYLSPQGRKLDQHGLAELAFGLFLGKLFFNIPFVGSLWLVFLAAALYLPVVLGVGLFISTVANTQQQAMFVSFFFIIIFILMSGLFTPIESMPVWAQVIVKLNPVAYFMEIMRMVLLKGSGLLDIGNKLLILLGFGIVYLSLAVFRYRKKE